MEIQDLELIGQNCWNCKGLGLVPTREQMLESMPIILAVSKFQLKSNELFVEPRLPSLPSIDSENECY